MWAFGCILAQMVFKVDFMFYGRNEPDQILKMTDIIGTDSFYDYISKYNVKLAKKDYGNLVK